MPYTIRDVSKALFDRINSHNLVVVQDGKNVRVRVLVGTPDELIAKKRYPSINIYPGFQVHAKKDWQSMDITEEIDGNFFKRSVVQNIDLFYTYKIGMYALFSEHILYLEDAFYKMFPLDFCLPVISDSDKLEYHVQSWWDGHLVNLDEYRRLTANSELSDSDIEGDQKVVRREGLVTAHISLENSSVESMLRPYSGVDITVETTLNS
jgi:hypothetical protein